jgi:hypothetical protein
MQPHPKRPSLLPALVWLAAIFLPFILQGIDDRRRLPEIVYAFPAKSGDTGCLQGSRAICKDGSLSYSEARSGACSWHGGVATWCN